MTTFPDASEEPRFAALVAIDWADEKHAWSLQVAGSERRERGELKHTPEAVEEWAMMLRSRFGEQPVAIALEQSRGALVVMLEKYEHLHLYPVHPNSAAQFRKALYPSGAKDDPVDADLLLELLTHHRAHLRHLSPETPPTRLVRNLAEARRKLVDEKTAHSNQLTAQLKLYFPQMLSWFSEVDSPLVGAMLERWPTLALLQRVRPQTLRSFLTKHNCRSQELIEQRLEQFRQALPATRDPALIQTAVTVTQTLVALIATLREAIASFDRQIAEAAAKHPDFAIFDSFPGAGAVMAPRLLAAFGSQRERYSSPEQIQTFSGIAPVTERSGKTQWVHFRWACPQFLRQTFHEWAAHSIGSCNWARAYYQQQRARGKGRHAAIRALAFKWIRIAFRCWKDRVPYDDALYVLSLRRRDSPLAKLLPAPNPSPSPTS
jgi:transposase